MVLINMHRTIVSAEDPGLYTMENSKSKLSNECLTIKDIENSLMMLQNYVASRIGSFSIHIICGQNCHKFIVFLVKCFGGLLRKPEFANRTHFDTVSAHLIF